MAWFHTKSWHQVFERVHTHIQKAGMYLYTQVTQRKEKYLLVWTHTWIWNRQEDTWICTNLKHAMFRCILFFTYIGIHEYTWINGPKTTHDWSMHMHGYVQAYGCYAFVHNHGKQIDLWFLVTMITWCRQLNTQSSYNAFRNMTSAWMSKNARIWPRHRWSSWRAVDT